MDKEKKKELRDRLSAQLDEQLLAIQERMERRTRQYEADQAEDQERVDFLTLQSESVKAIK